MTITVKLFAHFRNGRFTVADKHYSSAIDCRQVILELGFRLGEMGIVMVNGRHAKVDQPLQDRDTLALFPLVGAAEFLGGWPVASFHEVLRPALILALGAALAVITWEAMTPWPLSLNLLRFYPKRLGSAAAGWAASRTLPAALREPLLGRFARAYRLDLGEAEQPLAAYPSLQALFTRRLKAGLRPQAELVPGSVNSPVDGEVVACGRIEAGLAIQAKGLPYRIEELLKHDPDARRFEGGHYLTLYLSPKDYHRIHVPVLGRVSAVGRVEGELWPVNQASTTHVPRLYERNRRATWVAEGTGPDEGLEVAAVLVGATHVGGVLIAPRWLEGRDLPLDGGLAVNGLPCLPGEDLGTFQFGSTVVLLIGGPRAGRWRAARTEGPVRVGQRLGSFEGP